jgi:glutathione S-transferase
MLTLYQFAPVWGIPNLSPACVKVETYLRMVNLPYEVRSALPTKGPKGKLPFMEDQGKRIADSRFIIEYLKQSYSVDPDKDLNEQERVISNAMQRMIEDDLYWVCMYSRYVMPENWEEAKLAIFHVLPPIVRDVVALLVRRRFQRDIYGQGMGRHSKKEIFELGKTDLTALSDFLADKPFFMGEQPTTLDATAFGFLTNVLGCPIESPLKARAKQLENLPAFSERMKGRFFAEP